MLRHPFITLALGAVVLLNGEEGRSQDRPPTVFFDDFNAPPAPDAGYYSAPEGSDQRSDGNLALTVPAGTAAAEAWYRAVVLDAPIQSIMTRARFAGPADGGLGMFLRGGGYGSFAAGIGQGVWKLLFLERDDRGDPAPEVVAMTPTDLDITQDTMLRLDISNILIGDTEGTRLELWAWQGDTMPVNPQTNHVLRDT